MRKLATIRVIGEICPIENADSLELAIIYGWQAVVRKGEYKAGDIVVYCEIDSLLPVIPEYEFLRKSCYKRLSDGREGFLIKTIKLRGQLSQGLVLPVTAPIFQTIPPLGTDVTKLLGITHYDSLAEGSFPSCVPKTDEERIQNLVYMYPELLNNEFAVTEKLDGTSFTCYNYRGHFGVCSRTTELPDTPNCIYWNIVRKYKLREALENTNIAVQGEIIGPGIRGNKYNLKEKELYVFNTYSIDAQKYFSPFLSPFLAQELELNYVPIISDSMLLPESILDILDFAEGKSVLNSEIEREGLVFVSRYGKRISFKAISNKYLLKYSN
jgi:RNA ligase (TIGR02306 family)